MFVRNAWYVAASATEVGRQILPRRLLGQPLILWRTEGGDAVAMHDSCPHRLAPLSIGRLVGDEVRCGYHGMQFDRSGRCTAVPGQDRAHPTARVGVLPTVEKHRMIWIWLGDPALADPGLVPDAHWIDDPDWVSVIGYLKVEADYRLATDNLLDLSHETYVHGETIGNTAVAENPVQVEVVQDRLVRAHREIPGQDPPPLIAEIVGTTGKINRWQTAIYLPPGVHMTASGFYPVSSPREQAVVTRVLHLLTPETEHSTHYFWAVCRGFRRDDSALDAAIRNGIDKTFDEDRVVLELQSQRLREMGDPLVPAAAIKVDEAPVRGRRLLKAMADREQAEPAHVSPPIRLVTELEA